jgi:hypothetical protein
MESKLLMPGVIGKPFVFIILKKLLCIYWKFPLGKKKVKRESLSFG